ncbi:MAG: signal peptide peptidase SppA [Paludibacteraceae bacterium]|nr:signal peptide peptidase SppA [Paludibacteraceae bacterium]
MKQFLKMVLAAFVGMFAFLFVGLVIVLVFSASASAPSAVKEGSVLHLRLEGELDERSQESVYTSLGLADYKIGLDDILLAISAAKTDDNIEGIFLEPGALVCGSASLSEIRSALLDFRSSGKFVYAYSGAYTQGAYFLSTAADSVFLNPSGTVDWRGMAYRCSFYKRLLEKVGIEMQVVKVGVYKSFTEQYTNEKMSDANREQMKAFVGDIWKTVSDSVAVARNIPANVLQLAADSMLSFQSADSVLAMGMVDVLAYRDEVLKCLNKRLGKDSTAKIPTISPTDYVAQLLPSDNGGDEVAVVYAVGEIDNGNTDGINTENLSKELLKLANNDEVKAVVLRVNSPGGSAYGSEQVWHALQVLKQKKTLVVSMGDYAASGGYYISCGADLIVADPLTITGSIGIFGVIPNIGPLADKIGLDYDVVKTSEGADFPRVMGPMTPVQQRRVQNYVNNGYALFTKRCADGRKMDPAALEAIAQGRVWSGYSAVRIGLVDTLGTLSDATRIAADLANLSDYHVKDYPAKPTLWESMMETPSLGTQMFAPKEFEREKKAIEQSLKLDILQAALPFNLVIE